MSQLEKVFSWIIKIGLWMIPLLPIYVSYTMLFPFITGKNFAFRIIIEIIFALWVGLAIARREYRPKFTPLVKAVSIFVGIVFFADLISPNPYRAFFSNYERMEGFMMLSHLYLYFLMLTSVFKTRRDWLIFLHVSFAASVVVSYFGLLQKLGYRVALQGGFRVDSTIGNPTYLAAYLLFHLWLLVIMIQQFWKKWWFASLYAMLLVFELMILYFTATRGVVVALVAVAPLCAGAAMFFWDRGSENTRGMQWGIGRKFAAGALTVIVVIPFIFWLARKTDFVQSSQALRRLTNYSLSEGTIQDRFKIWGMSLRGGLERPIFGWGQENYYLVFQKYFHPKLYGAEPWFDRSHNVFLDWFIHAGIPGLISYCAIFAIFFWQMIRRMRRTGTLFFEGLMLLGLLATYFLQNLFVFDNLNTYLLFFAVLAYGSHLITYHGAPSNHDAPAGTQSWSAAVRGYAISASLVVIVAVGGYWLHIKPIGESKSLIKTLKLYQLRRPLEELKVSFEHTFSHRSFGDTEVREQLANVARQVVNDGQRTPEERVRFFEFAIPEVRKEIERSARDVKHLLLLGSLYNQALTLDTKYAADAEKMLLEAVRVSPRKQIVYFELAQHYLTVGNTERGVEALEKAWRLEPHFKMAGVALWTVAAFAKKPELVEDVQKYISLNDLDEADVAKIATAYQRIQDYASSIKYFERLVYINPKNPQYHAVYAAHLAHFGKVKEARAEAAEAARLDPAFKQEGLQFLKMLEENN